MGEAILCRMPCGGETLRNGSPRYVRVLLSRDGTTRAAVGVYEGGVDLGDEEMWRLFLVLTSTQRDATDPADLERAWGRMREGRKSEMDS